MGNRWGSSGGRASAWRLLAVLAAPAALVVWLAAPVAAQAAPNVLVIVTDDQRAEGTMRSMPETRDWIFDDGTEYSNAVATTPLCCPSRVSMLTGQYAHNHGVFHNSANSGELAQLDPDTLLQSYLHDAGYRTGIVGKYLNGWGFTTPPPNFDDYEINGGQYFDTTWNVNGDVREVAEYSTTHVGRRGTRFIQDQEGDDDRPWFLWAAPFAPHASFTPNGIELEPEAKYARARVGALEPNAAIEEDTLAELADKPPFWQSIVAELGGGDDGALPNAAKVRKGQLRLLLSADDMVGRLRRALKTTGELKDTLVVFVSDNGLMWGEHGDVAIKDMPWTPSIDIPLALRWPGHVAKGAVDERAAANLDLMPTVLDAAGIQIPATVDGRSLLEEWTRQHILIEYGGFQTPAVTIPAWAGLHSPGSYQYTMYLNGNGTTQFREYYDLAVDPWQLENPFGNGTPADDPNVAALNVALTVARSCVGVTCP